MLESEDAPEQLMRGVRWDAPFGRLAGCIDLDEHRDAPSQPCYGALQLERNAFSVERVHQMHQWRDCFDFVRLESADEVPAYGQMLQRAVFCDELLRVVFANVCKPRLDSSSDAIWSMPFPDSNNSYRRRDSASMLCNTFNLSPERSNICSDLVQ